MVDRSGPGRFQNQGSAPCRPRRFGILPLVTDHERAFQVQLPLESAFDEQPWLRLAARTTIRFGMGADGNIIQWHGALQRFMHAVQFPSG